MQTRTQTLLISDHYCLLKNFGWSVSDIQHPKDLRETLVKVSSSDSIGSSLFNDFSKCRQPANFYLHVNVFGDEKRYKRKFPFEKEQMGSKNYAQKRIPDDASFLVMLCLLLAWFDSSYGDSLDPDEVTALRAIAKQLGKNDWNFSVDPCSNDTSWRSQSNQEKPKYDNQLNCTCSGGVCHVVNLLLKGQDLAGALPKSLAKLPYLKHLDLSRNYLTGSIPPEWASMSLEFVSITINRLSGTIPAYLGNITTLTYLSIENNMFSGPVPSELGKLVKLRNLTLNANYLTGRLPEALKKLSSLIELRISSNNFSGKIPDYFQSWTALQTLEIQGSGLRGPIPSSISSLTNLTQLRISDLDGDGSDFPQLGNMANLAYLMLRSCKISGSIPDDLAGLSKLKALDLSFNNLQGPIPNTLQNLKLNYMYLTSNFLTGSIPDWIKTIGINYEIDLSYNSFSESSLPSSCNKDNLNLYRSSSRQMNSSLAVCLKNNFPCSHARYSLHINCGGNEIKIGKTSYEADTDSGSAAKFDPKKTEWGFSSTGNFWDTTYTGDFIARNDSVVPVTDAELYTEARMSPISLTYYGRCLANGNYTVILYFAEIQFRDNSSFYTLGRRIFDVYIQEKLVLKDFDIVKAANGSEKIYNQAVNNVTVGETGTIEIRFYYAGKGTTAAPVRGTYGPLISAISVKSEFNPPPDRKKIMKIALGSSASVILLLIILGAFIWRQRRSYRLSREEVLEGLDLQTGLFTHRQIKAATDNFDPANKIGEGGFGSVYRGTLLDGTHIAVKRLSSKSSQGNREFVTELGMISGLHHPNLVKLYGCCVEGAQLFLVYEYMVNNNLARALFDEDWPLKLDWPTRQRVCTDIARGLVFLHEESTIRIVHRDIKATNILLDENLNAKISDFGLARLREEENTHISTRVAGTIGYMSPEYALWGYLTYKADVYSFGVVALEIVAGRSNMDFVPDEHNFCLLDWAVVEQKRGDLMGIIDAKLESGYNKEEAVRMIKIALLCTNVSPALRPTMSEVVSMLEGNLSVEDSSTHPNAGGWMAQLPVNQPEEVISETQSLIHSSSAPLQDSSN